ncbi:MULTISPECIES: hypothetical protein [unclassified Leclercia]|uniref:hypothetical protein n=1 Tax=unclassified Leclercia TaxID=2627398 RepID=UPI0011132C33|nr:MULTISPECIES: hypothetical protein [unclassified Leclercia]MBW9402165.1 hypothetical protein [Leclercia sp. EC_58]
MGFQALATDAEMARLAMKDPEHLSLVMVAIKMLGIKYKESRYSFTVPESVSKGELRVFNEEG